MTDANLEERYLNLLLTPLDKCADYKPRFGSDKSKSVSLEQFRVLYGGDPFYHWIGLDSDLMYAAHKAAGGMTSIYVQVGRGWQQLLCAVMQDALGLTARQVVWSYEIEKKDKTKRTQTLDARIDIEHVKDEVVKSRIVGWLHRAGAFLNLSEERIRQIRGAVFETRQGYKSADAKRVNADLGFGMNAASENYLPVMPIISTQASQSVLRRYRNNKMLVMIGSRSDDDITSTFAFFEKVIGFDLAKFFERNTVGMRERCLRVLDALLTVKPSTSPAPGTSVTQKRKRHRKD